MNLTRIRKIVFPIETIGPNGIGLEVSSKMSGRPTTLFTIFKVEVVYCMSHV